MPHNVEDFEISDYNYIASALGNGFFSGLTMMEVWSCVSMSKTREELDEAIAATIWFKEVCGAKSA